jgi:heme-degrading monooxygenase HmoA
LPIKHPTMNFDQNAAGFAPRFHAPYYAVIFTSRRRSMGAISADDGYAGAAARMAELAALQPGFIGVESARDGDGLGITVSYWETLADIAAWRAEIEHRLAREQGRERWYSHYELRVARIERAYGWDEAGPAPAAVDPGATPPSALSGEVAR